MNVSKPAKDCNLTSFSCNIILIFKSKPAENMLPVDILCKSPTFSLNVFFSKDITTYINTLDKITEKIVGGATMCASAECKLNEIKLSEDNTKLLKFMK